MKRALSAARTKSQASATCTPIPAAVPFTAATTGFSQSRMAGDEPLGAHPDAAGDVTGDALGNAFRPWRPLLRPQIRSGAEMPIPHGGEHDGAHGRISACRLELGDEHRSRIDADRVAGLRPVDGQEAYRTLVRAQHLRLVSHDGLSAALEGLGIVDDALRHGVAVERRRVLPRDLPDVIGRQPARRRRR